MWRAAGLRRMRLIQVTVREGLSAVYLPQVVRPISMLAAEGHDVELLVFVPIGDLVRSDRRRRWRERAQTIRSVFGLTVRRFLLPPSRIDSALLNRLAVRRALRLYDLGPDDTVQCRGAQATKMVLDAVAQRRSFSVTFDCRGLQAAEIAYSAGYADLTRLPPELRARVDAVERTEREVASCADQVLCVSNAMARYLVDRWGVDAAKITVIPCCTDVDASERVLNERERIRDRLGLKGRFVVVYNGSLAAWQLPEEGLSLFKAWRRVLPECFFLALTPDATRFSALLDKHGLGPRDAMALSVRHDRVPETLVAGDVGLLLRERCLVNQVASPVKFAEYLAVGLPVVLTEGVGDWSDLVRQHRLGVVIPELPSKLAENDLKIALESVQRVSRSRVLDVARACLDWRAYRRQASAALVDQGYGQPGCQ